jgi:predicted phage baseplate assembly protein
MSLPIPDLDDKSFDELFAEARSLIPRYTAEWTDHNFSDPGMTFIDLFAWLAEMQIYRLNRINDQHKRKFLKLLGTTPRPAMSATVDVTFYTDRPSNQSITLPKGTQVAAADPNTGEELIFETDDALCFHYLNIARVLTYDASDWVDNTSANNTAGGFYFAFGTHPAPNATLNLGFETAGTFPSGAITLTILVYNEDLPPVNERADGQPAIPCPAAALDWQFYDGTSWQSLALRQDDTAALTRSGRVTFEGPTNIAPARIEKIETSIFSSAASAELYWLRVRVKTADYEIPPRLKTVLTNTIPATQGQTVVDETLTAPSLPHQTVRLLHRPVLHQTLQLELLEEDGQYHQWVEVPDFDASAPHDRHYTIDLQEGLMQFGNGIHGRIPPPVADAGHGDRGNVRAKSYRFGGGANGNVLANTITRIVDARVPSLRVKNPRDASGGTPAESPDDALHRVRKGLKIPSRAVNSSDFAQLALTTPGLRLARAKALPFYHPAYPAIRMPGAVTVVVVPYTLQAMPPKPSHGFLRTVERFLQERRLIGTQLYVIGPAFMQVQVEAHVQVKPRFAVEQVIEALKQRLSAFIDPVKGGTDGQGWAFGRAVFKSEIYEVLAAVEGVQCVDRVTLKASTGCHLTDQGDLRLPRTGLAYSGEHTIHVHAKLPTESRPW